MYRSGSKGMALDYLVASFETNRIVFRPANHKSVESPMRIDWFHLPFDVSARIEYCSMSKKGMMPGRAVGNLKIKGGLMFVSLLYRDSGVMSSESPIRIDWFHLLFDVSELIEYCSMSKKGMMPCRDIGNLKLRGGKG